MASALVAPEPVRETRLSRATETLLDIGAADFCDSFDRRPFLIQHRLSDHPLFALPRLLELCRGLPAEDVEYNAGNLPVCVAPELTPRNGLSAEETIRRIAECKSWLVLKYIEHDPEYRALLHQCLAEVAVHSEPLRPGMGLGQGFIFISSPGSVTPYHMDPEHNFLLQIRGTKHIRIFNPGDRSILSEEELERFYDGAHRNMVFKEEYEAKAWRHELHPGDGLHFPGTAPHYVRNGPEVSISFSITFRTPDLDKWSMIYNVNAFLRRRGLRPAPVGQHPWRDALKCTLYRAWRKTRNLFGRKAT